MKLAFERGDTPPSTPAKGDKSAPNTPKKAPRKSKVEAEEDSEGTPTTHKRKRTPAKKKVIDNEEKFKADAEDSEDEEDLKPKRAKAASKSKPKPKPKNGFKASDQNKEVEEAKAIVNGETIDENCDVFFDAPEHAAASADTAGEDDEVCKSTLSTCYPAPFLLHVNHANPISACFYLLRSVQSG
jgi:hypothetical protein